MSCVFLPVKSSNLTLECREGFLEEAGFSQCLEGQEERTEISQETQRKESWPDVRVKPGDLAQGQRTRCPGGQAKGSDLNISSQEPQKP